MQKKLTCLIVFGCAIVVTIYDCRNLLNEISTNYISVNSIFCQANGKLFSAAKPLIMTGCYK